MNNQIVILLFGMLAAVMPYAIPEGGAQAENIRTLASWIGGLGV